MAKNAWGNIDPTRKPTYSQASEAARQAAAEEDTVRLNLEVPARLRKALQKMAIDEGVTMKELGTRILSEYVERMNERS